MLNSMAAASGVAGAGGAGARGGGGRRGAAGASRPRRRAWHCPACLHDSVDPRRVCGGCLAVEPGVAGNLPRGDRAVSEDPTVHILTLPHGRCYRVAAAELHGRPPAGGEAEALAERRGGDVGRSDSAPRTTTVYTHFVSLPIGKLSAVRPSATLLLQAMKQRCLDPAARVTDDIFTTAQRMHLTLLMLSLPTQTEVALAKACMEALEKRIGQWQETCGAKAVDTGNDKCGALQIHLCGLHVMKRRGRDVKKADVLYMGLADAASTALVTKLQQLVQESFAELTMNDPCGKERSGLLHITLLNNKWRGGEAAQGGRGAAGAPPPRVPFDATRILQEFGHATLRGGGTDGAIALECIELNALGYDAEHECYHCECATGLCFTR
ncbi:uncharacterized protein Tco025E_03696 [Trypanosoma conorhini]|uniref:A-kinase anchor protein 7-like phosphoesterase domain-containing protein n=1 Tax=Trypanosoma conorhini TaxID=83891 RepID=A0A3R7NDR7_9TRYP|nr:uncharacterized protein Tco025E_03696 [Trypanosoma conorhini]RNF20669.1 hypothetical protein Tco025E_03696 [Trypanosoma conorhini]